MRRIATIPALLGALLMVLTAAPGAHAAARLVVKGHGFGHGIGMSQYGAMGYAEHGTDYKAILEHYYDDTAVQPLSGVAPDVRVLLQSGSRSLVTGVVSANGSAKRLSARSTYSVRSAGGGRVTLYSASGRRMLTVASPIALAAARGGAFTLRGGAANGVANGRYRGALQVRAAGGGVESIDAVGLEDYVRGVVSAESPPSWPIEALKAQAVAARTYAITTDAGSASDGFTQYADTRSQMYKGVAAEGPTTDAAVAATAGQVVTMNGTPVTTYFFSTSGGYTEDIENSFVGSLPRAWLKGVADPYDSVSPRHSWGPYTFSQATVQAKLKGLVRGSFRGITVLQRGVSPRIVRAEVDGSAGATQVTGPQLRARFGLFDTWASFTYISSNAKKKSSDADAPSSSSTGGTSTTTPSTTAPSGGSTSAAADPTGGQAATVSRLARPSQQLTGTIQPGRAGRAVTVQQRLRGTWTAVTTTTLRTGGRYTATVPGPGTYRVALGAGVTGPAVDIR
jgi:stage II sporulation protein D